MNKKALVAIILLIIVIAGAAFWMLRKDPAATNSTTQPSNTPSSTNEPAADQSPTAGVHEAIITYTDSGYSPSSITVKSGDTVVIKNSSTKNMMFDSDPHPAHTTNAELNVDEVEPGQSQSFVVNRTGTFGYHNHLNASQKGTIVVE